MGLTVARCPACGASLDLETDRDYFYCPHCGSKVIQHDEHIVVEHVIRTIDDAKVKEIELEHQKFESKEVLPVKIGILCLILLLVFLSISSFGRSPVITVLLIVVFAFVVYSFFKSSGK